eukprot:2395780-Pyramimonas_sp.AAC.1
MYGFLGLLQSPVRSTGVHCGTANGPRQWAQEGVRRGSGGGQKGVVWSDEDAQGHQHPGCVGGVLLKCYPVLPSATVHTNKMR